MAHLIEITIAGGAYGGPEKDTKIIINADKIQKIENLPSGQIGKSKITMDDNAFYYVGETQAELVKLANK